MCCIFRCLIAVKGNFSGRKHLDSSKSTTPCVHRISVQPQALNPRQRTKQQHVAIGNKVSRSHQDPRLLKRVNKCRSPVCPQLGFRGENRLGSLGARGGQALVLIPCDYWCLCICLDRLLVVQGKTGPRTSKHYKGKSLYTEIIMFSSYVLQRRRGMYTRLPVFHVLQVIIQKKVKFYVKVCFNLSTLSCNGRKNLTVCQ